MSQEGDTGRYLALQLVREGVLRLSGFVVLGRLVTGSAEDSAC